MRIVLAVLLLTACNSNAPVDTATSDMTMTPAADVCCADLASATDAARAPTGDLANGGGGVKWHPGHYASTNQLVRRGNLGRANRQAEIDLVFGGAGGPSTPNVNPNVLGYIDYHTWATIETDAGTYDFSEIDWARGYIAQNYPGKRYGILILTEGFNASSGPPDSETFPDYLVNDIATYGAGSDGTHSGYWSMTNGQTAAWWRPAVSARIQAMFDALAKHTSPYGGGKYTYDTDPYVEAVAWDESATALANAPSDATTDAALAQWTATTKSILTSFPHTQYLDQISWFFAASSPTITGDLVQSDGQLGASLSGPDIWSGTSNYSWGQDAYIGDNGFQSMQGTMPFSTLVQEDYSASNTVADIGQTAIDVMGAGEVWWCVLDYGDSTPGDWSAQVLPYIDATPIRAENAVCPSNFVARGGCISD